MAVHKICMLRGHGWSSRSFPVALEWMARCLRLAFFCLFSLLLRVWAIHGIDYVSGGREHLGSDGERIPFLTDFGI